jgi:hypothetical protein
MVPLLLRVVHQTKPHPHPPTNPHPHPTQHLHSIPHCTDEFNELLIERMCNVDPNQRPSASEVSI